MNANDLARLSKEQLIELVLRQQGELVKQKLATPILPLEAEPTESWRCPVGLLFTPKEHWLEFNGKNSRLEHVHLAKLFPPPCANRVIEASLQAELEEIKQGQRKQLERATREALRHLDDVAFLRQSPLLAVAKIHHINLDGGIGLQQKLRAAIEAVGPGDSRPPQRRWQLRRNILYWTYLDQKKVPEIIPNLPISERQYYRELKMAIRAVLEYILSHSQTAPT